MKKQLRKTNKKMVEAAGIEPASNPIFQLENATPPPSPPKVHRILDLGENHPPDFGPTSESATDGTLHNVSDQNRTMGKRTVSFRNLSGTMYFDPKKGLWRGRWNLNGVKGGTSAKCKKKCEEKIKDALKWINEGKSDLDRLKPNQIRGMIHVLNVLENNGHTDLHLFANELKLFNQLAPSASLIQAAEFWRDNHNELVEKPFGEAADHWYRNNKDRWKRRTRLSHESRANRFKLAFQINISDLTYEIVSAFFEDLSKKTVQKTRNHYRETLRAIIAHSVDQKWIRPDHGLAGLLKPRKTDSRPPKALTPYLLNKLLNEASQEILPCVAIMAFTGCRTSEIAKVEDSERGLESYIYLQWEDVFSDAHEGEIEFNPHLTKTSRRRLTPMPPVLRKWLEPYRGMSGPVWPSTPRSFESAYSRLRKKLGIATMDFENCMRDSYVSFQMALLNDAQKVSAYVGNSADKIHNNYRELKSRKEAEEWFAVYPQPEQSNVIIAA